MFAISLFVSLVIISKVNECPAELQIPAIINSVFTTGFVKNIYKNLRIIGQCTPEDLLTQLLESPEFDVLDKLKPLQLDNLEETLSDVINNINSLLEESQKCLSQNRQELIACLFNTAMRAIENISNLVKKFFPPEVNLGEIYTKIINAVMFIDFEDC